MSDETLSEETVEETGVDTDDYFGADEELIDDNGNLLSETTPEKPAPAEKPAKAQAGTPTPAAEAASAEDGTLKEIPEGFESRFFEKDDKGAIKFKGEDATKFLFPEGENPTRFKYSPINIVPEDPNAAKPKADDVPPWKKAMNEEKAYRESLRTSLLSPLNHFEQAIRAGNTPEQALAYAKQKSMEAFEEHIAERQFELEAKRREELEKEGMTKGEMAELRSKAAANEALFYNEVGGKENFDALLFGSVGKDGKAKPGVGSEDIWMLFKMANPDVKTSKLTASQLNEKMANWWTKTSADREQLAFAFKIVKGTLTEKMRPYLIEKTRQTALGQQQANREGAVKRPAGMSPAPKTPRGGQANAMSAFFDPMASREGIASV